MGEWLKPCKRGTVRNSENLPVYIFKTTMSRNGENDIHFDQIPDVFEVVLERFQSLLGAKLGSCWGPGKIRKRPESRLGFNKKMLFWRAYFNSHLTIKYCPKV